MATNRGIKMAWDEQKTIVQRLKGQIERGHVTRNATTGKYPRYHAQTLSGRDLNDIEHFQSQGMFITPEINDKTEVIILSPSGDETKSVILSICPPPDKTFIPDSGCGAVTCPSNIDIRIDFNKDGVVINGDVVASSNLTVKQDLVVDGDLQVGGDVKVTGIVYASSFVEA